MAAFSLLSGFAPVVVFLLGLRLMDSFKLVHRSLLYGALAAGIGVAVLAWAANQGLGHGLGLSTDAIRWWLAPPLEEVLKAAVMAWCIRRDRVGFVVDAAIVGFAVGAGFALAENVYYALALRDSSPLLWLVRGFGTAVMHGSTTALFAILGKALTDLRPAARGWILLPALVPGITVHMVFNHLAVSPVVSTAVLLGLMPLVLMLSFEYSERATRRWLSQGFDGELEMLERILEGDVAHTRVGEYLEALRHRFPPMVVADLFCLLTVHLELSLRAKGLLLARDAGLEVPADDSVRANLEELHYLERAVGPTGLLAVQPLRRASRRELWQILLLARTHGERPARP